MAHHHNVTDLMAEHGKLVIALQAAQGQIMNANIDLKTGHTKAQVGRKLDDIVKFIDAALSGEK